MVCSAMGFPKLNRLILHYLINLENWRVEEGSMPVLSELMITVCTQLKELPEGVIFLDSLRKLRLTSKLYNRVRVVNDKQGPDFYKVAHIPNLIINSVDN